MTEEHQRLSSYSSGTEGWKKWGPYLSEWQWGTVREDLRDHGNAWAYLPHDHARSKAYRWGEYGIAGISDDRQILCFSMAFWNEKDHVLFYEYFHGDNGTGIGASHKTGWTGTIATLFALFGTIDHEGLIGKIDKFNAESVTRSAIH